MIRTAHLLCLTGLLALAGAVFLVARPAPSAAPPSVQLAPPPREAVDEAWPNLDYTLPPEEQIPDRLHAHQEPADLMDWGVKLIDCMAAWEKTKGKGAVVAVLDTGVDTQHRDLKDRILKVKDFTGSRTGATDVQGHGTHCAGVVAATENRTGVIGVAPEAMILGGKVLGDSGSGSSVGIASGIRWAVDEGADVISMSLGGGKTGDPRIASAIAYAVGKGVIVVVAAGNSGPREDSVNHPGNLPDVIAVAAVDVRQQVATFSSRGKEVMVAAPGVSVKSCYPGDRFATMSGTSMACPHVAGVAALYCADAKARGVKPTPAEFKRLIQATSLDLPPQGRDTATGFGLIQPGKIVGKSTPPVEPKNPDPTPGVDRMVMDFGPGVDFLGRRLRRVVYEFDPLPQVRP